MEIYINQHDLNDIKAWGEGKYGEDPWGGLDGLAKAQRVTETVDQIRSILKCPQDGILPKVRELIEEIADLKAQIQAIKDVEFLKVLEPHVRE